MSGATVKDRPATSVQLSQAAADGFGLKTCLICPAGKVESKNGTFTLDDEAKAYAVKG